VTYWNGRREEINGGKKKARNKERNKGRISRGSTLFDVDSQPTG
jgi:hypothetical protein